MPVRLLYLDVARGLGSLLVVLGHNALVTGERGLAFAIIFSFHLPLFFFMSGLFLKTDGPLSVLVRKRADALLKPFFATFLLLAIDDVLLEAKLGAAEYFGGVLYASGLTIPWMPLWFLPHLWLLSVLAWLVCRSTRFERLSPYAKLGVLGAALALGASTITFFLHRPVRIGGHDVVLDGLPFSLDLALVSGSYYLAGYLARERFGAWTRVRPLLTLALLAAFIVLHAFEVTMDLNLRRYDHVLLSTLAAALGIYLTLALARMLVHIPWVARALSYVGAASLFVLIFHKPFQDKAASFAQRHLPEQPVVVGLFAFAVAVAASLVLAELIKRVKPLALLYLPFGAQPERRQRPASELAEPRQA